MGPGMTYQGLDGGLYGGGSNSLPPAYSTPPCRCQLGRAPQLRRGAFCIRQGRCDRDRPEHDQAMVSLFPADDAAALGAVHVRERRPGRHGVAKVGQLTRAMDGRQRHGGEQRLSRNQVQVAIIDSADPVLGDGGLPNRSARTGRDLGRSSRSRRPATPTSAWSTSCRSMTPATSVPGGCSRSRTPISSASASDSSSRSRARDRRSSSGALRLGRDVESL